MTICSKWLNTLDEVFFIYAHKGSLQPVEGLEDYFIHKSVRSHLLKSELYSSVSLKLLC